MSTIKTDTLQNVAGTKSVPVNTVVDGSAKAWVNFNGTGTVAVRASFNVSSITDNGTGDYTINFTSALSDANYDSHVTPSGTASIGFNADTTTPRTTSALRVRTVNSSFVLTDDAVICVTVFR